MPHQAALFLPPGEISGLAGAGEVNVTVTAAGITSNPVTIVIE